MYLKEMIGVNAIPNATVLLVSTGEIIVEDVTTDIQSLSAVECQNFWTKTLHDIHTKF